MMDFRTKKNAIPEPMKISSAEKYIYCLLTIIFFLCFSWCDFEVTTIHGIAFLDCLFSGKILQFYSFAIPYSKVPPVYDFGNYLVFGIWELPLYLMGKCFWTTIPGPLRIAWCKVLLIGAFFLCASIIRKICHEIDSSKDDGISRWLFFILPVSVFPVVFMSQYDILYMIPMLAGLLCFIRKRYEWCAFLFGLAACFKVFPLIFVVPLLLFAEKRKKHLFFDMVYCAAPLAAVKFLTLFEHSQAVTEIRTGFFKTMFGRLFFPTVSVGIGEVGLFACAYIIICFLALALSYRNEEERIKRGLFLVAATIISMFLFILWHIHWCILLAPFIIFATVYNARLQRVIFYAAVLFSIGILLYYNESPDAGELIPLSPIAPWLPKLETSSLDVLMSPHSIFMHYDLMKIITVTIIISSLILLLIFALPCWKNGSSFPEISVTKSELWGAFSLLAVLIFIPQFGFYIFAIRTERAYFSGKSPATVHYAPTWNQLDASVSNKMLIIWTHLKSKSFRRPFCLVPRLKDGENSAYVKNLAPKEVLHSDILDYTGVKCRLKAVHIKLPSVEEGSPPGSITFRLLDAAQQVVGEHKVSNFASQAPTFLPIPVKANSTPVRIEIVSSGPLLCERVKLAGSKGNRSATGDPVNYFLEFNDPGK